MANNPDVHPDGTYQVGGTLTVLVKQAKGIKGEDHGFERTDPYAVLWLGSRRNHKRQRKREQRTQVHKRGGSNPVWDQTFVFEIDEHAGYEMNTLYISLYDRDIFSGDPLGDLAIDVPHHLVNHDSRCQWYMVYYKHHPRGMVEVSLSFKASESSPISVGSTLPSTNPSGEPHGFSDQVASSAAGNVAGDSFMSSISSLFGGSS